MLISEKKRRKGRKMRWAIALMSLALIFNSGSLSADWLSKLKDSFGKTDKEQVLSTDEVGSGLKEALRVGTDTVVGNLGHRHWISALHGPKAPTGECIDCTR
jgi:hypothetical protein